MARHQQGKLSVGKKTKARAVERRRIAHSSNLAKSEIERIRKEARDEAIKETEAKFKRKVQETVQCIVCLQVPRDGHITQCQNGHLMCEVCTNKNNGNECPSCRAKMDKLTGILTTITIYNYR